MITTLALLTLSQLAAPTTPTPTTTTPTPPAKVLRVAVYEFEATGVDPHVGTIVTDSVVSELRKLKGVSVVSMDEVRAMLDVEAKKQLTGCEESSCLAEIADALGADGVVIGTLAAVDGAHIIGMRRLDQKEGKALGSVNQRLEGAGGEEYLAAVGPAIEQLFPEFPLKPGQTRGVAPEVALRINPPPLPVAVFYGAAAVTGALVVAAGAAGVMNGVERGSLDTYLQSGKGQPLDGAVFVDKQGAVVNTAAAAWACLGGAVVAGGATAVVALFTDWNGYGEARLTAQ